MKDKKELLKILLKILVSFGLMFIIFSRVDKQALINNIKNLNLWFIPLIIIFILLNYIVSSIRWKRLLNIYEGASSVGLVYLIKLYFIGAFFNNFLPTSIGGDVYKAYKLGKRLGDQSKAFASAFMERFTGVLVLVLFSLAGLVSTYKALGVVGFILFLVCVITGYFSINYIGKWVKPIQKFMSALNAYKNYKREVLDALLSSVFVQIFSVLTQYFIFVALGYSISLSYAFFAFPVIFLISIFVPAQSGVGVQDSLYGLFFVQAGVPLEVALSASIVYHIVKLLVSLLGGVFYVLEK